MKNIKNLFIAFAWVVVQPVWAADITVSAASSLTQAFQEIAAQFEAKNPGVKVRFNFAASGALLQQIVNGAPVDVFASADTDTMDKAIAKSVVNASDSNIFTTNRLMLITPLNSTVTLSQLSDLKTQAIQRIAMGVPASVPAGRYALGSLEQAGLWSDVKDKIISTQNVRQALDYVARGEVDAAFVYASDTYLMTHKVKTAIQVNTSVPIQYPIARTVMSKQTEAANQFIAFVQSPGGQAVLKKFGFGNPPK